MGGVAYLSLEDTEVCFIPSRAITELSHIRSRI